VIPMPNAQPCDVPPGFTVEQSPTDDDILCFYGVPLAWVFRHGADASLAWEIDQAKEASYWSEYLVVAAPPERLAALLGNRMPCRDFLLADPEAVLVRVEWTDNRPVTARRIRTADLPERNLPVAGTLLWPEDANAAP